MKKFLPRFLAGVFSLLLLSVVSLCLLLFFRPEILINLATLKYTLEKSQLFKSWSWEQAEIGFKWNAWNDRNFRGEFKNFCFEYTSPTLNSSACLKNVSWNFRLNWSFKSGFIVESIDPLNLRSDLLIISQLKQKTPDKEGPPPPLWKYWTMLWAKWFPDLDIKIDKLMLISEGKKQSLDLEILKKRKSLVVQALEFKFSADPTKIVVTGKELYRLPEKIKLKRPLEVKDARLTAWMKEDGIPLKFAAALEGITIDANSYIDLPLKNNFSSIPFRKDVLLRSQGRLKIYDIRKVVHTYVRGPYDELPAPINVMNGEIEFELESERIQQRNMVLLKSLTHINLQGKNQVIRFSVSGDVPLNVSDFSRGLIQIGIEFSEVSLQLPRLSRKEPPPQFFPDKRFKTKKAERTTEQNKNNISMDLQALNEEALHIRSNLLDEPLRLNFDLDIRNGEIHDGFLKILPLKTTVFKRPVRIRDLVVSFNAPLEPVIESTIKFPLPEYKITLKLEGPLSRPRHVFSSKPPLPQNDIYAVLLFGRPLSELNSEDKNAARQTNKLLAQGILSLSVLYFLSGSPVEYIGYDPETGRATAQFGIDRKTSLNVGAGKGGRSTGVRRSLGKGWYLDTSVQSTSDPTKEGARDYGVLLERIIAY